MKKRRTTDAPADTLRSRKHSQAHDVWRRLCRNKLAMVGLVMVAFIVLSSVFAPLLTRYDYAEQDILNRLQLPSREHILGTDNFGRDLWSRCLYGGRVSLLTSLLACAIGTITGVLLGAVSGLLKSYCNVNEVISCIMLNWISLYLVNMLLSLVKESASPYTMTLSSTNPGAILPSMGLEKLFNDNKYVTIAIPLAILVAILIWVLLEKTKLGYELKATGCNKFAAKYCGMKEKKNLILTMAIAGGLAGMGAAMLFLTGFEQWQCTQSSVPAMGFNGIAAAFLGGLSPIGTILSSYFIQHITNGGAYVDKTMYCAQISDLISSIIIYLCGFVLFMKHVMNSSIAKREEKAALKAKAAAEQDAANGKGGDQA